MTEFPAMRARDLLAVLTRKPLGYETVRQRGSHRRLKAAGPRRSRSDSTDRATVASGLVRKILCRDVGLGEAEALKLL